MPSQSDVDWLPRDIVTPASEEEREAVRIAQRALRLTATGVMDGATRASLRGLQHFSGIPATGMLDRATAERIQALRPPRLA